MLFGVGVRWGCGLWGVEGVVVRWSLCTIPRNRAQPPLKRQDCSQLSGVGVRPALSVEVSAMEFSKCYRKMLFWHITKGLIPAHAGSTSSRSMRIASATAHPRSRGEHPRAPGDNQGDLGSSPLTRGALRRRGNEPDNDRAHPRSRGEHAGVPVKLRPVVGSSPLTRGARRTSFCGWWGRGLIPAHAGSTRLGTRIFTLRRAHPRSRGEHE